MEQQPEHKIAILPLRRSSTQSSITSRASSATASSDQQEQRPKRTRASKPKVRSGCLTCKIRRIKCDELKPACQRCTSTGRKCDGYPVIDAREASTPPVQARLQTPTPEPCLEMVRGTPQELRGLEFFHRRTSLGLGSFFDADVWMRLVPQMGHAEPAIKHAIIAIGSLHQARERETQVAGIKMVSGWHGSGTSLLPAHEGGEKHSDSFATVQYNKAIMHLSNNLRTSAGSVDLALMTCLLFICIEFLRGDAEPAMKHFYGGMSIALNALGRDRQSTPAPTIRRIEKYILPFFNRLELPAGLMGLKLPWKYPVQLDEAVPEHFVDMTEVRDSLVHIMNIGMHFSNDVKARKRSHTILPDDIVKQNAILQQVDVWQSRLESLLLSGDFTAKEQVATKVLRLHHIITKIWVSGCTAADESVYDAFVDDFQTAIQLGEAVHKVTAAKSDDREYPMTFLLDIESVSPLYIIATKCRHPQIRRRAIQLLRSSSKREGLWDSSAGADVAERVMIYEEATFTRLGGTEWPPKERMLNIDDISSMPSPVAEAMSLPAG